MHSYADLLHFLRPAITSNNASKPPYLVAIDGYAGAGKSSLAKRLVSDLPAIQCLTLDDFYRPLNLVQQTSLRQHQAVQAYFDTQAFCQQVLVPLHKQQIATWQPIDWLTQNHLPAQQLHPCGVIIIEGVVASHDDLMAYMDTSVMVTAPTMLRAQRVRQRPQQCIDWWQHWQATENWFHTQQNTQSKVAWLVDGAWPF